MSKATQDKETASRESSDSQSFASSTCWVCYFLKYLHLSGFVRNEHAKDDILRSPNSSNSRFIAGLFSFLEQIFDLRIAFSLSIVGACSDVTL
jgi:hypothetical protein